MKLYKNKYNKEELKELIIRLDSCLQEVRGLSGLISDQLTPTVLWAYETEDSDHFFYYVSSFIARVLSREGWEIEGIIELDFEDIPLHLVDPDNSVCLDTNIVFNTILRWRLDCGR